MNAGGLQGLAKSLSRFPLAAIARLMSGILNRRSWAMEKEFTPWPRPAQRD